MRFSFVCLGMIIICLFFPIFASGQERSITTTRSVEEKVEILKLTGVSIRSINPNDTDFSDLMPLVKKIGKARIVVLGEGTHSEGTTSQAKTRMVRFLHQKMGFDVLVWEGGLMQGYLSNEAFKNEAVPLREAKGYLFSGGWSSEEAIQPLFEDARASWKTSRPLEMSGFDMGKPRMGAKLFHKFLEDFVKRAAPVLSLSEDEWKMIDSLSSRSYGFINSKTTPQELRASERKVLEELLKKILSERKQIEKKINKKEIEIAQHFINETLISEHLNELIKTDTLEWNRQRDLFMAENLRWLSETLYPKRKIIVWAATAHLIRNSHLIENSKYGKWTYKQAGDYFSSFAKKNLYTIAFTAYGGKYGHNYPAEYGIQSQISDIIPAPKGSFEATAHELNKPYFYVDLRNSSRKSWLREKFVSICLGREINDAPWSQVIDAFFFINQAEPIKYLSRN